MADIKTKDSIKGTIKMIDKAAIAGQRMKQAYVQTKEETEHATHAQENSAEEYAADRFEGGVDRLTHEVAYQFDKQGRKGVEATKQNISKAKDEIRQFKEKRAAEALKNQSVRTTRNKGVKAVQETQKTVKQTARSSGKKTIKTVGKGSAKTAQKTVKTAEQTAKTSIKTTKQAAKAAQKTAQAAKATAKAVVTGIKAAVKATIARSQGDYSGNKGSDCRHCCRGLDCSCGNYRYLPDCAIAWLCVWDILFG